MYFPLIMICLIVLGLLTYASAYFHRWVRVLLGLYYSVISFVFIYGRHRIHLTYNMYDGPVIDEGWSVNSNWASSFSFAFLIPLLILLIYIGLRKVNFSSMKRWQQVLLVILISFFSLLPLYFVFNLVYGMRP